MTLVVDEAAPVLAYVERADGTLELVPALPLPWGIVTASATALEVGDRFGFTFGVREA